jgi:hypothetical protein
MTFLKLSKTTALISSFFILLATTLFLTTSITNAQSADGAERAAASCTANGGTWDGTRGTCTPNGSCLSSSFLGLPTWYKYLDSEIDSTGKCTPVLSGSDTEGRVNSALPIGLAVLEAMLRLAGMVAVVMIFVAGFKFITSDGSPDKAAGARKTVINAIIGLAIVVLSTGLVTFIGSRLS